MKFILPGLLVVTVMCCHPAFALTPSDYFGTAVANGAAGKTIIIDSKTRYVNVNYRDTVTFVLPSKRITWHFDGISTSMPLSKLIGLDRSQPDIVIYVASIGDR